MPLVLRSNRVLLRERGKFVIAPARVRVVDALIERVEREPEGAAPEHELDLGERLITPAFVNAHTHLALSFLRGLSDSTRENLVEQVFFSYERRLSPADIRAFSRMGAYESLLSGVGFVWDHYYGGRAVADALLDTGLSGVTAPTLQDLSGPGMNDSESALAATLEIARDEKYRAAGITAALGPHATDTVSPSLFRRVAQLASQEHLPVHLHVAQSYHELLRVETREGRSPMALLSREGILSDAPHVLMAHALFANEADLHTLDNTRHTLVYCPSSQLQFGFPAPVPLWSELGVRWTLGTDCGASNDSMSVQHELRLAAGAASAMTTGSLSLARFAERGQVGDAEDAWAQRRERVSRFTPHVTSEALLERMFQAGSLHPALKAGSIEPGALANLAVWDHTHPAFWPSTHPLRALAFGDTTHALHALYVAGKAIGTPGDFARSLIASDSYREARREANERLAALIS